MKFSVGEIAVYVGPSYGFMGPLSGKRLPFQPGDLVTIASPTISPIDGSEAYFLDIPGYPPRAFDTREINLRKRPYKDQHTPAEQSFGELISSLKGVGV